MNNVHENPNTDGVLSVIDRHCLLAEQAIVQANESLATLPVIFEAFGDIPNRGPKNADGTYDTAFWGVNETTVRRYRLISSIVELEWEPGFDLLGVRTLIGNAFRTKGVAVDDIRDAIEECDTAIEAVIAVQALIDGVKAEAQAQADTDEAEAEDAEAEIKSADDVLKWLKAVRGPLGKVREAVTAGHTLSEEQATAFDEVLSLVSGIASARAFVPAQPVAVSV